MRATNLPVKLSFDDNPLSFEKKVFDFAKNLRNFVGRVVDFFGKRYYSVCKGIFRRKCYDPLTCYYLECAISIEF